MSPSPSSSLHTALVHDWLTGMRGGEKVLEALCELYPDAPIYTLLHNHGSVSPVIEGHTIHTSFIQKLPLARERYRNYLPLFPFAIERFDLSEYDVVISSSHCAAKAVRTLPQTLHICYCHTPMRYIWNQYDEYFGPGRAGLVTRMAIGSLVGWLREWDVRTAVRPNFYLANSENVKKRIKSIYQRDADVLYPPIHIAGTEASLHDEGYFLMVTAMVPYKRVDIAIETFNRLQERLVIVGSGPDLGRLKKLAGRTIEFPGWLSDAEVDRLYAGCKALIFPGEEDFGMVPVEAMAHGKPVVAYAKGGALETVHETPGSETGVLFGEQSVDSLVDAVSRLLRMKFDPQGIRRQVLSFDRAEFKRKIAHYVLEKLEVKNAGHD